MSAWLSVYCLESVVHITPSDLLEALDLPDPYLEAEVYGIEDEAIVDASIALLRIEASTPDEFRNFELYYGNESSRPIVIDRKAAVAVVQELIAEEVAERLAHATGSGVQRIRAHLSQVCEIVDFELGYEQLQDMGLVFSLACARFVAETGHGFLKDQDGIWWEAREGMWTRIFPED
jgi:hypothetical protein